MTALASRTLISRSGLTRLAAALPPRSVPSPRAGAGSPAHFDEHPGQSGYRPQRFSLSVEEPANDRHVRTTSRRESCLR